MAYQRRSTVFDYSDLRLHPDGLRVYQAPTRNLRPTFVNTTVKTSRENWIARDAGGSGTVPKFRPRPKKNNDEELGDDDNGREESLQQEEGANGSGEEQDEITRKRKRKSVNKYKLKRLKFASDFDYLAPSSAAAESPAGANAPGSSSNIPEKTVLPEPSADLLKAIHKYASEFYTERGQLINTARLYRLDRKRRAALRQAKHLRKERKAAGLPPLESESLSVASSGSGSESDAEADMSSESSAEDEDKSEVNDGEEAEAENGDEQGDQPDNDDYVDDAPVKSKSLGKGKQKEKSRPTQKKPKLRKKAADIKMYTDMYKVFDGSAMIALGMLVQEHIAHLLTPRVPPGWDDEMRAWYGNNPEDGEGGEEEHSNEGTDEEEDKNSEKELEEDSAEDDEHEDEDDDKSDVENDQDEESDEIEDSEDDARESGEDKTSPPPVRKVSE